MSKIKLFCIPYAGGGAAIYKKWEQSLLPDIERVAVELAGRGRRSNEQLYKDVPAAVEDVYNCILPSIMDGKPYAIFGHSMGAMLTFQVAHKIAKTGYPKPAHLFFGGRGAPHVVSEREKMYHEMLDEEFKEEVLNLGGTPQEFFDYPELVDYMMPILKNDFKISETAPLMNQTDKLKIPFTVFIGKEEEDQISPEAATGWYKHTTKKCAVHFMNGGHFFINDEYKKMIATMRSELVKVSEKYKVSRLI